MLAGFGFQFPVWAVLVLLLIVAFGAWKVAKIIWAALSN
jgi:hypothetical protein